MSNIMTTNNPSGQATMGTTAAIFSPEGMDRLVRFASLMADSKATIPAHLAGKPADCLAVTMQAAQWGMNPFAVAQKTHVVNGTLGYEAQLVNAVVSSSSLLATRLDYVWEGDWSKVSGKNDKSPGLTVTVSARIQGEEHPRSLTISMAQAGVRNSPNWEHDPKQQLAYLCVKRWARLHAPDVLLGVYTPDELEPAPRAEREINPSSGTDLNQLMHQQAEQPAAPAENADLVASLQQMIEEANTLELAVAAGEAVAAASGNLQETTFRSLRAKAGKVYKHHDSRRQIEARINGLDSSAPDAAEDFKKVESELEKLKAHLGEELYSGFVITLGDMRAEYQ